jgi:hypothetical protein
MQYMYKEKLYIVINTNAKIKENDKWVDAIIYTNESGISFTRTKEEFIRKFVLVPSE